MQCRYWDVPLVVVGAVRFWVTEGSVVTGGKISGAGFFDKARASRYWASACLTFWLETDTFSLELVSASDPRKLPTICRERRVARSRPFPRVAADANPCCFFEGRRSIPRRTIIKRRHKASCQDKKNRHAHRHSGESRNPGVFGTGASFFAEMTTLIS